MQRLKFIIIFTISIKNLEDQHNFNDNQEAFYFGLSLSAVESIYEQSKVKRSTVKKGNFTMFVKLYNFNNFALERTRKEKKMELKNARDKLENLTITIKNEGVKKNKNVKGDQVMLLERLKGKH